MNSLACMDLDAKSLFKSKSLSDYQRVMYSLLLNLKLSAAAKKLLVFSDLYLVEDSFNHTNALLIKLMNRLNFRV